MRLIIFFLVMFALPVSAEQASTAGGGDYTVRVLLEPPRDARLASQVDGRISNIAVRLGDRFSKGDVLVQFDCLRQRAQLKAAQAGLDKAKAMLESRESLVSLDAVSDLDVQVARADLANAQANYEDAKARVGHCQVRAPYDGRVVRVAANEFEIVSAGTALIDVVESGTLTVEAIVPSRWLAWLSTGQAFEISVDELGRRYAAQVERIGGRVDPVSQTIVLQGKVTGEQDGLLPGMSGEASFPGPP